MTDREWMECTDPQPMLGFLGGRASERKLRQFAVACCRRAWALMTDPRHRDAVAAADLFADGRLSADAFAKALQPIISLWGEGSGGETRWSPFRYATAATRHLEDGSGADYAAGFAASGLATLAGEAGSPEWTAAYQAEGAAQCELLRDLFSSPSRPIRLDPGWLLGDGGPSVDLARQFSDEGKFDALARLADVLEQSGCSEPTLLEHCRGPRPHGKGCWVLDALLVREAPLRTGMVTEADWWACSDPTPLLSFLQDKGSNRKWRLFAVACCRRIAHLITDERSRRAVEVAAQYAEDAASDEELESARMAAREALEEAKYAEWRAEAEANFCWTSKYAAVVCHLNGASAARSAVGRDPRRSDDVPGSFESRCWSPSDKRAAGAVESNAFANCGREQGDAGLQEARRVAAAATAEERRVQCDLLRDLFGDHLGSPSEDGSWLPRGLATGGGEQWCLLPTPRSMEIRPEWLAWSSGAIPRMAQVIYDQHAFDLLPVLADALEEAGCTAVAVLAHLREPRIHVRGCWPLDSILGKQ